MAGPAPVPRPSPSDFVKLRGSSEYLSFIIVNHGHAAVVTNYVNLYGGYKVVFTDIC